MEKFFSWENIQNGLIPSKLDILRYVDALGISNFLSEDPCKRDMYPYTDRDTYWNNCKCCYAPAIGMMPDTYSVQVAHTCVCYVCM